MTTVAPREGGARCRGRAPPTCGSGLRAAARGWSAWRTATSRWRHRAARSAARPSASTSRTRWPRPLGARRRADARSAGRDRGQRGGSPGSACGPGRRCDGRRGAHAAHRRRGRAAGAASSAPLGVFGHPASLGLTGGPTRWLVESPRPIGWSTRCVSSTTRRGLRDLPCGRRRPAAPGRRAALLPDHPGRGEGVAVAGLIVAMALLEIVLLAGPAFAVGAQRQRRALALLAATGATPAEVRRVVLGRRCGARRGRRAVAGMLGSRSGWRCAAWSSSTATWFGPFEVARLDLAVIAAFGLLSAVLAALVPGVAGPRQDVVAVLAGRRGDRRAARPGRSGPAPARRRDRRRRRTALAARGAGELADRRLGGLDGARHDPARAGCWSASAGCRGRLPLPARFAVRDAARQRTRTVPAVAAIAATVAGVVALGVGARATRPRTRETYTAVRRRRAPAS